MTENNDECSELKYTGDKKGVVALSVSNGVVLRTWGCPCGCQSYRIDVIDKGGPRIVEITKKHRTLKFARERHLFWLNYYQNPDQVEIKEIVGHDHSGPEYATFYLDRFTKEDNQLLYKN